MEQPLTSRICILPNGKRVNLLNFSDWELSSYTITFTRPDSTTLTYADPFSDPIAAQFVLEQLDQISARGSNGAPVIGSPIRIDSVLPSPFDVTSTTITIRGAGFLLAAAGKLWVEDAFGGMDFNGFSLNCTVIDDTMMTAVYTSSGDATLLPTMLVAYKNAAGTVSNILSATNTTGNNITVP